MDASFIRKDSVSPGEDGEDTHTERERERERAFVLLARFDVHVVNMARATVVNVEINRTRDEGGNDGAAGYLN
jgi:hypothetical protein